PCLCSSCRRSGRAPCASWTGEVRMSGSSTSAIRALVAAVAVLYRTRRLALAAAACLLALAGVGTTFAATTWQVSNTSRVDFLGTNRKFTTQTVTTAAATSPYTWKTIGTLVIPRVPLAFGQYVDFLQNGTAQGVVTSSTGAVTLALPIRLRDNSGATQSFTANLTTGATNGTNSDGGSFC